MVTEREATFASARLTRQLTGDDAASALTALGLDHGPNRAVYEIAPGSREVKASVGDFSWAMHPRRPPASWNGPWPRSSAETAPWKTDGPATGRHCGRR